MSKSFRNTVFALCKKLSKHSESYKIRKTIHDMTVVVESKDDDQNIIKRPSHGDLAYIGSHQHIQFLGYLLADESVNDINNKQPFHATHLESEERQMIEKAHQTIRLFIDMCIEDVKEKYPRCSIILDPYFQYNRPKLSDNVDSFLGRDDYRECIETFKAGKVYKKIINNDALQLLERVDDNMLRQLAVLQKKQFTDDLKSITKETNEYFEKIRTNSEIGIVEVLMTYCIYCYALRCSIETAIQMFFEAILGEDMVVMDNDNIIDLSDHKRNIVYEMYTILSQDIFWGIAGRSVGSLSLLTCDPTDTQHIKEFGVIVKTTDSFHNEFGNTSKITIISVDDELNMIHRFTDAIMETNLGKSTVEYK